MASSATNLVVAAVVLSSCLAFSRCEDCPPFHCGYHDYLTWPFANAEAKPPPDCHPIFFIDHCEQPIQKIRLGEESEKWYDLLEISPDDGGLFLRDGSLSSSSNQCEAFETSLPPVSDLFSWKNPIIPLLRCNRTHPALPPPLSDYYHYDKCTDYDIYYNISQNPPPPFPPQLPDNCTIIYLPLNETLGTAPLHPDDLSELIATELYLESCDICTSFGNKCQQCRGSREAKRKPVIGRLATAAVLVALIALLVYCFWIRSMTNPYFFFWKKNKSQRGVEAILKTYGSFAPKRYTYSEVKKFTNSFKNKLGEGGYGGVYQGTLPDSRAIAVKVLKESKGSGEEFINEVASISRTSHVNIVTLMGFCFERTKRALVYEFMPNGSLEKFIYDANIKSTTRQLGWETLFQIALGIARGLEYLHRGCNTRIVHFDIKPHNILLDEEFCPKIADFGLSKLCSNRKDSILSMLGARGTPGYTAPEVFCRSVGNVSHKSDVYSYGMMVLEMVGGRKNIDVGADHTSEIYFPHWIHGRLHRGSTELELHGIMDEEEKVKARKMIIIGLWCIQTDPNNGPAMDGVLDMFQGSIESLQIPPLPVMSSSTTHHS